MKFAVMKDHGDGRRHQVGGPVKTVAKAYQLRQRMKDLQPLGSSASFSITTTR